MPTAPTATKALPASRAQARFSTEKQTFGGITLLTLQGTLDQAFDAKKVADTVHTKALVLNMRDVRRFASWGMSEWMEFLKRNAERDLYIVECSTYAVSQINLVTGLLGHAKLVSFYASYRCGSCSEELATLFLVPRDRESIRELPGSQETCPTCGGRARLEEYPAAFFDAIANRASFDIDDQVLAFLRSHFVYDIPIDTTRFRAHRRTAKEGYTYLRLSGSLTKLPSDKVALASDGTTVLDLERVIFDPSQVTPWRTYLQTVLPKLKALHLLNCPPGFLATAVVSDDLREKLKVRTFALLYSCHRCNTTTPHLVDVAENLEQLVQGTAPSVTCSGCQSLLVPMTSPDEITVLRSLPARDRDPALDRFLTKARGEPEDKLEDALTLAPKRPKAPGGSRALYLAIALGVVLVGAMAFVGLGLWKQGEAARSIVQQPGVTPQQPQQPTFVRPDWIIADVPSSAYCHDLINVLVCVGVSSYRTTRDEAVSDANDAALEELVSSVGLKISDPMFRENVMSGYTGVRAKALSTLQAADVDRASAAYSAADEVVRKARRRVVEILESSGGPGVPTRRTDWYWEEYAKKGGGTETLVFVRYDVTLDAVKALVDAYSTTTPVMGSTAAVTAFPALAWQYSDFTGGAMLTKVGAPFDKAGLAAKDIVMAVGEQRVSDATSLAHRLDEWKKTTGALKLSVKSGDSPAKVIEIPAKK